MERTTAPKRATPAELRRFRLYVLKNHYRPNDGYDIRFFSDLFLVSIRQLRYDLREIKNGSEA